MTTLQVKKQQAIVSADPTALIFNHGSSNSLNLPDETVLLKSFPLLTSTISDLDFAVSYYYSNPLKKIELHKNSPIKLSIDVNSTFLPYEQEWKCLPLDSTRYIIEIGDEIRHQLAFNKQANIDGFIFTVNLEDYSELVKYNHIIFKVNNPLQLVRDYQGRVKISPFDEKSSIINISVVGENPDKEIEFLNSFVKNIIDQSIQSKRLNSERTAKFIDEQLSENTDSLKAIEGQLQRFKNEKATVDLNVEGNQLYTNIKELEKQKADLLLSNRYLDYLIQSVSSESEINQLMMPAPIDGQDPVLAKLLNQLVDAQLEVKLLANDKITKNPLLQEKKKIIKDLKDNITYNVKSLKGKNNIRLKDMNSRISMFSASLQGIPKAERELVNIKRDHRLNENLYLLFMEKRIEAGINAATIVSDYSIINHPINEGVVSASPLRNYSIALLLGTILPVSILLVLDFLSDKVRSKDDVERMLPMPIICSVVHKNKRSVGMIDSNVLESFRSFRANLQYLPQPKQVLLVTSSMSGEGKTFSSYHLSQILAITDKKVVWINADLRVKTNGTPSEKLGLSEYLAQLASIDDIIEKDETNVHIIRAGKTPHNPAELLVNPRMQTLVDVLKEHFDYIIIDTPPVAAFSDAFELMALADQIFVVVRQKFTKISALATIRELLHINKIEHISIILNDVKDKRVKYASKYYAKSYRTNSSKDFIVK
ncbi:tyrosine-protein kinase family protein [Pontibacter sp. SGAir0037]|uniref:GumC family protein n=1 Tax=Pontibacter sp. SGAir0037 TaxID=2571030 RepID=UPI00143DE4D6|nr:tyrosine-protein kinase family protein [Pontibacter sp. SGAir0037]